MVVDPPIFARNQSRQCKAIWRYSRQRVATGSVRDRAARPLGRERVVDRIYCKVCRGS